MEEMKRLKNGNHVTIDSTYTFDAAWAIALTLNASVAAGMKYEDLQNRGSRIILRLRDLMQSVSFEGITVSQHIAQQPDML